MAANGKRQLVADELDALKCQLRTSRASVDGTTEPPPAPKMRERDRRASRLCIRMLTGFIASGEFDAVVAREHWGTNTLSAQALAVGRLFSFLARLADGLSTTPDAPARPFSQACTTLEQLRDAQAYAHGVAAALAPSEPARAGPPPPTPTPVHWTMADEIFHFARGVEAFLSGCVTVFADSDIVTRHELAALSATEMRPESALAESERVFASISTRVNQQGFAIIRNGDAKDRSKTLAAYVFFHVHGLHRVLSAESPPAQRRRTDGAMDGAMDELRRADLLNQLTQDVAGVASGSAHASARAFATNRPLTSESPDADGDGDVVLQVYGRTDIDTQRYELYRRQSRMLGDAAAATVASHLVVMDPAVTAAADDDAAYRASAAASGVAMHVALDTRTAAAVAAGTPEAIAERLQTMNAAFRDGGVRYAPDGVRQPPSELWTHMQAVLADVAASSTAAQLDARYDRLLKRTGHNEPSMAPNGHSAADTVRAETALLPIDKGQSNTIFEWRSDGVAPTDTPRRQAVEDARSFLGTFVRPSKNAPSGAAAAKKGPSQRKRSGPAAPPTAPPTATRAVDPTRLRGMLIRAPTWDFRGLTLEQATDLVCQVSAAAAHDVGAHTPAFLIFDMSRLYDPAAWKRGIAAFRDAQRPHLDDLTPFIDPAGPRYGVLMIVERLAFQTNQLLGHVDVVDQGLLTKLFKPKQMVDGCVEVPGIDACEKIDSVAVAMVALWRLLAKMSSMGFLMLDFHLGNVMFNPTPDGAYTAKIVDIDPKLGIFLSPDDVYGPSPASTAQGWKPLLVLNALVVAALLATDTARARLLQKWMNSDREFLGGQKPALHGSAYDIGHANRFRKMVTEVADAARALSTEQQSVPLRLLSTPWRGGVLGHGFDNFAVGATPESRTQYENPLPTVDGVASADVATRMEAALRVVLHNALVSSPRVFLEATFRRRQVSIEALAATMSDFSTILRARSPLSRLEEMDVDRLKARYHHAGDAKALAEAELTLRFHIPRTLGPIVRHVGRLREPPVRVIDLIGALVFKTSKPPFLSDTSLLRPIMPPATAASDAAAYAAAVDGAVSMLLKYNDPSELGDLVEPTGGL